MNESQIDSAHAKRAGGTRRRPPPRLSAAGLERHAQRHLDRYPSSVENLRRVLKRRVARSSEYHDHDPEEARAWVDAAIEKLLELGLLDDRAYGRALARRMRARGASARRIAAKLQEKGVASDLADHLLAESGDSRRDDLEAARIYVRRRRLGPHRSDSAQRAERRDRDLAALARAGFDFATAEAALQEAPTP